MSKKYELTQEFIVVLDTKLFRIKALVDIVNFGIKAGDLGGFIEKQENLDQSGDAWVSGDARVYGNAWVYGNAQVYGNAMVSGDARVSALNHIVSFTIMFKYSVTITPDNIFIGCQLKKRVDWLKVTPKEAESMGLDRSLYPAYRKLIRAGMKLVPSRKQINREK